MKAPFSEAVSDSVPKVDNAVAVGEDLEFQERWWRFERVIWSVFALLLLADVLGIFGRGWLSKAEAHTPQMDVRYERVVRSGTPSILQVHFRPEAIHNGQVQLYVSETVLDQLGAERVIPQPASSVLGQDGVTYTFPVSGEPATVQISMSASFPGVQKFRIRAAGTADGGPGETAGGEPVERRVVVLP